MTLIAFYLPRFRCNFITILTPYTTKQTKNSISNTYYITTNKFLHSQDYWLSSCKWWKLLGHMGKRRKPKGYFKVFLVIRWILGSKINWSKASNLTSLLAYLELVREMWSSLLNYQQLQYCLGYSVCLHWMMMSYILAFFQDRFKFPYPCRLRKCITKICDNIPNTTHVS